MKKNHKKIYYSKKCVVDNYNKNRFGGVNGFKINMLELNIIKSFLPEDIDKSTKILDIPCGSGRVSKFITENFSTRVTCCDFSFFMLDYVKKNKITQRLTRADAFKLPYKDESFDIITSIRFFSHYPDTKILLNELKRVIKKNGIIIFDTYLWSPMTFFKNWFAGEVFTHTPNQIQNIVNCTENLKIIKFKSHLLCSPLFYKYLPKFFFNLLIKIEKFLNKNFLVHQFWALKKL
jgi:ubiquinone/menaquinone biosynthesis C-methylase UbiE